MTRLRLAKDAAFCGNLILVNADHPIQSTSMSDTLSPALGGQDEHLLCRHAAVLLQELLHAIQGEEEIVAVSGFRPLSEQQKIWDDSMREHGASYTRKYVAIPGCSEHQTGLAIDLGEKKEAIDFICPDFPYAGICQKFRQNAPKFEFIERYPSGKETVTGIGAEPWHFRYVGLPHSLIMTERNFTLEEYITFLKNHTDPENPFVCRSEGSVASVAYISADGEGEFSFDIAERAPLSVSGTNEGEVILTGYEE